MTASYVIAMDVHSYGCHVVTLTPSGRRRDERPVPTSAVELRKLVQATPKPRRVVFEEGPLADWLYRNLVAEAEEVIVAETRRNAYVAKDGDKSDAIDAAKLGQLYRGGFIRPVHHSAEAQRASFKDLVLFYRKQVNQRTAKANLVIWAVRAQRLVLTEKRFATPCERQKMLEALPRDRVLRLRLDMLLAQYDQAVSHEQRSEQELTRRARKIKEIRRFQELPGIGWIRAATFYALIDTPFRFRSKSALWRYMGIGLERRSSGKGREHVKSDPACNRYLKYIIIAAAQKAVRCRADNPFKQQYWRCIERGQSPRVARRTVARSMALTMWGMWKSDTNYRPDWVGLTANELSAERVCEH